MKSSKRLKIQQKRKNLQLYILKKKLIKKDLKDLKNRVHILELQKCIKTQHFKHEVDNNGENFQNLPHEFT